MTPFRDKTSRHLVQRGIALTSSVSSELLCRFSIRRESAASCSSVTQCSFASYCFISKLIICSCCSLTCSITNADTCIMFATPCDGSRLCCILCCGNDGGCSVGLEFWSAICTTAGVARAGVSSGAVVCDDIALAVVGAGGTPSETLLALPRSPISVRTQERLSGHIKPRHNS
jgi:hypothetical protein